MIVTNWDADYTFDCVARQWLRYDGSMTSRHRFTGMTTQLILLLPAMLWACLMTSSPDATARGETEYQQALTAYKQRSFQEAARLFSASINKGNTAAAPWLYMAESNLVAGNTNEAIKNFHSVVTIFKEVCQQGDVWPASAQ